MSFVSRAAARVGGFGASVALTGATALAVIPVIVHFGGADSWAAYAVGQTIGALLAVLTWLGWLQLGPSVIARADGPERSRLYIESLVLRVLTLVITAPAAILLALVLVRGQTAVAAVSALASLALACGAGWFFVGTSQPKKMLVLDTVPRVVGTLAGAAMTALMGDAVWAGVGALAGALIAIVCSSISVVRRYGRPSFPTRPDLAVSLRGQWAGLGVGVFAAIYLSVPLLFVSYFLPLQTATFALADRLKQQGMAVATPFAQTIQGWVPRAGESELRARIRRSARFGLGLGAAAGAAYAALAVPVGGLLGANQVDLDLLLVVPVAIAFGLNVITLVFGSGCLIPAGRARTVFWSAVTGTSVVIPAIALLAPVYGVYGVAWAAAASQLAVLTTQSISLWRYLR